MKTKICPKCCYKRSVDDFGKNRSQNDGLQLQCKLCKKATDALYYKGHKDEQRQRNRLNRHKNMELMRRHKAEVGCTKCGEKDPCCLDFHHKKNKKFQLSDVGSLGVGQERLWEEIAKCEVLCANCHRKFHAGRFNASVA